MSCQRRGVLPREASDAVTPPRSIDEPMELGDKGVDVAWGSVVRRRVVKGGEKARSGRSPQ